MSQLLVKEHPTKLRTTESHGSTSAASVHTSARFKGRRRTSAEGEEKEPKTAAELREDLQGEAYRAAKALAATSSLSGRVSIYKTYGKRVIFLAARLWPELMPTINGEFEFLYAPN